MRITRSQTRAFRLLELLGLFILLPNLIYFQPELPLMPVLWFLDCCLLWGWVNSLQWEPSRRFRSPCLMDGRKQAGSVLAYHGFFFVHLKQLFA